MREEGGPTSKESTRYPGVWIWNEVGGAMQRLSYLGNQSSVTLRGREREPGRQIGWLCSCFIVFYCWICVCWERKRENRDHFHHV